LHNCIQIHNPNLAVLATLSLNPTVYGGLNICIQVPVEEQDRFAA
jgi:hypothetical protein